MATQYENIHSRTNTTPTLQATSLAKRSGNEYEDEKESSYVHVGNVTICFGLLLIDRDTMMARCPASHGFSFKRLEMPT